ncbi:hypothetical protein [Bifidobacterium pullorum]|uniref:hypothetical protein n=1 Tax=Bifidobacterium pullorum TaxID=78448 RepID=UPI00320B427E
MSSTSIMRRDGSTVTVVNGEHSTSIIDNSTGHVIGFDDQSAIRLADRVQTAVDVREGRSE